MKVPTVPRAGVCAALLLSGLVTSAMAQTPASSTQWVSELYQDHSLVGRIWDARNGNFITEAELIETLLETRVLLLGEKHDNPDHHSLQSRVVDALIRERKLELLSLEMLDSTQKPALESLAARPFDNLDQLQALLAWDEEGWNWMFYGPLIALAQESGVPVRAGNISSEEMRVVYAGTDEPLYDGVLDAEAMQQLHEEIDTSHCGMLPESQFPAMVRVQMTRDQSMARSLEPVPAAVAEGVLVLIAGNFHIRRDLGVPRHLIRMSPGFADSDLLSLALLEVSPDTDRPQDYMTGDSGIPIYDFVWFTPALTAEDYCATLQ